MRLEDISLDDIYDFIESKSNTISPEIERYLDLMDKVRGMHLRITKYGSKEMIVSHLMKVENLSRYLANKIYVDTLNYFYCDNEISKETWRNIIVDKQEKLINLAMQMVKDVNDVAKVAKMNIDMGILLQLDKEDPVELPMELFQRPFKLYSFDAKMLGLPTAVDKAKIAEFIDNLPELTEKERHLMRQEALLEPLNILPEDHENVRKSE